MEGKRTFPFVVNFEHEDTDILVNAAGVVFGSAWRCGWVNEIGLDWTRDFQIIYLEVMVEGKGADVTFEGQKTKQKANKFLDEDLSLREGIKAWHGL